MAESAPPSHGIPRPTLNSPKTGVRYFWACRPPRGSAPAYDRLRKGILTIGDDAGEIDISKLGFKEKKCFLDRLVKLPDEDNEKFLLKLRNRIDQVGITTPTIEVRFEHLNVEAEASVGAKALPTIPNFIAGILEVYD
ncbi:unnamed protein product [Dovyalis caffra]|uniref:Pleiotropic ABC efflux transporter N-terminal domain-containing protein n=1 Tax=Dovyalis caffra TaxID=77055 RepID=A0AAV1RLK3_9ROSI|nr:unnamed protein product [Dovyalis caffra]